MIERHWVVQADNYNRENTSEKYVCTGTKEECDLIKHTLNGSYFRPDTAWYKVVDNNYKLYKFEP